MNLSHLHLILNHVPIIGTGLGLALLLVFFITKSRELVHVSFMIFLVQAILAIPVFITGGAAAVTLASRSDIPPGLIDAHKNAALWAFLFLELTGLLAWLGLWQVRRFTRPAQWTIIAVFVLSSVTMAVMARTGTSGGEISHREIRSTEVVVSDGGGGRWNSIGAAMRGNKWTWSASETLHFIGMAILFGVVLLVNLRILGIAKDIPFSALHRLMPFGVLGFVVNVVTGTLFFVSDPRHYLEMPGFVPKMALLVLAAMSVVYFTMFDGIWTVNAGKDAPWTAKLVAVATIALWVGVIFFGRMLPYYGV